MKKNLNNNELNRIKDEIIRQCRPILERMVDEISSTKFYDAADAADTYYNTELAKRFRKAGDERREIEKNTEYQDSLEILDQMEVNRKHFYVCNYIPASMKVLVYLNKETQCAIARIKGQELVNIKSPEILSDIAAMFNNREPVSGNAVKSISMAIKQDRNVAKQTIERINNACGSNLSWRYLFGDKTKREINSTDANYQILDGGRVGEYEFAVAQYVPIKPDYSIYYIMIGSPENSFMMYIKTVEKEVYVRGVVQMLTPYRVMRKEGKVQNCPAPSSDTSDIAQIYDFFENNPHEGKLLLNVINKSIENAHVSTKDIERGFRAKYGFTDVNAVLKKDTDQAQAEDMSDFADF